jgi:hypothetical protein
MEITKLRIADNAITKARFVSGNDLSDSERESIRKVLFVTNEWLEKNWFQRLMIKLRGADSFIAEQERKFNQIG